MSYISDFQKAHDNATSQNKKDWLLIKATTREVIIGVVRAFCYVILFPPALLCVAVWMASKVIISALVMWPSEIWNDGLARAWRALKALRHVRNPTLPVNAKIVRK